MHRHGSLFAAFSTAALAVAAGCSNPAPRRPDNHPYPPAKHQVTIRRSTFGTLPDGTAVDLFTLTNAHGMQVQIANYGGIITSIRVPDRQGKFVNVLLGHDSLQGYLSHPPHLGAIMGRYANRIANAQFTLDGTVHRLTANDGPHAFRGASSFERAMWEAQWTTRPSGEVALVFTRTSADGEEGFPGTLAARVTYTLNDDNELSVDYYATTDQPTVVNLSQHTCFNLTGDPSTPVLRHELLINAAQYLPIEATLVPVGELASVAGTPFDFRTRTAIAARSGAEHPQLQLGKGYNHSYVLNRHDQQLTLAARLEEPSSGRVLEVHTTQPGLQLYSSNDPNSSIRGKSTGPAAHHSAVCLQAQHFPNSPNQPSFPSTTLRPGEQYISRTLYRFSTQ